VTGHYSEGTHVSANPCGARRHRHRRHYYCCHRHHRRRQPSRRRREVATATGASTAAAIKVNDIVQDVTRLSASSMSSTPSISATEPTSEHYSAPRLRACTSTSRQGTPMPRYAPAASSRISVASLGRKRKMWRKLRRGRRPRRRRECGRQDQWTGRQREQREQRKTGKWAPRARKRR